MERKTRADYRDAVRLADMLYLSPLTDEAKRDRLLKLLAEFEETAVALLINNRIEKYAKQTAVHIAAKCGLPACLEVLLKRGGNPNAQSSKSDFHQTPLHLAVSRGYVQCIQVLMVHGACTDIKNYREMKPITLARGKPNCEKILREYAQKVVPLMIQSEDDEMKVYDLHQYVLSNSEEFFRCYQSFKYRMCHDLSMRWTDFCQRTLLYSAVEGGDTRSVKLILDCSPNSQPLPNLCSGDTPLLVACKKKIHDKAKLLLEHSPKLIFMQNKKQDSALHIAVMYNDIEMITILLEQLKLLLNREGYKASYRLDFIDGDGNTPFYNACNGGNVEIVRILIEFQKEFPKHLLIDIDKQNGKNERTALHAAVQNESLEIINMLLEMGVNINRTGKPTKKVQGKLIHNHFSVAHSNSHAVNEISRSAPTKSSPFSAVSGTQELLLSIDTSKGRIMPTPLKSHATNVIIDEESIAITDSLVCSKTQIAFCDAFITPLAEACVNGSERVVKLLLKHGARDNDGLACRISHFVSNQALAQLILSFHCEVESDEPHKSHLKLQWDAKGLSACNASWLSCSATFSPKVNQVVCNAGEFYNYSSITAVNLSKNALSTVPIELFHLPNVTKVNLSNNKLSQLPTRGATNLCGWSCSQIQEIDVSHNYLTHIPICVWILPKMREICCETNNLVSLSLPAIDEASPTIIKVNFSHNEIATLPGNIISLFETLEELNLSNNHLTIAGLNFPSRVNSKSVVKYNTRRTLTRNTRSRFSHYFGGIEEFSIGFQPESDFPVYDYSSLQILHISNNSLTEFPEVLSCIVPNLKELDVSNNSIECIDVQLIPQYISKLSAANCNIKHFGNTLTSGRQSFIMENCCSIYTQTSLCGHRSHRQLLFLTELDLSGNSLTEFQVFDHTASRYSSDSLAARVDPSDSVHLLYPNLISLNLERNELAGCFNPNIGYQVKLKKLFLSSNHALTHLPLELGLLNLTDLGILDTPNLVDPPLDYQNTQSLDHVEELLRFLKARIKGSRAYRTIKLFFIGKEGRGKTTLKTRLSNRTISAKTGTISSTVGIDVGIWEYKPKKAGREPVKFLTWDFAGQDEYHTTHQCFYSRRSLYLALFRLDYGDTEVEELTPWLKNVKLHAPGCPVIIIGTHLDRVSKKEAHVLEEKVLQKYSKSDNYPQIAKVTSINSTQMEVLSENFQSLRDLIYDVACHLKRTKDNMLQYDSKLKESDPKALLNELVPESFIQLQSAIQKKLMDGNCAPFLKEEEFNAEFKKHFDGNTIEMKEAVRFLGYQGTLLHFDDHQVNDLYFLEPEWLAKYMAQFIKPNASSSNGIVPLDSKLYNQFASDNHSLQEELKYLLEKFELAFKINDRHMIAPSLMCDEMPFTFAPPKCSAYPHLRRFWLSDYIPSGFWSRLICRIVKDRHISKGLNALIDCGNFNSVPINLDIWKFWKTGMALIDQQKVLFILKQGKNEGESKKVQLELHIYFCDFDVKTAERDKQLHIHGLLTRLLVSISQHIELLTKRWFPGLFEEQEILVPCWKCFEGIDYDRPLDFKVSKLHSIDSKSVFCFILEQNIVNVAQGKHIECPLHGILETLHIMPDLTFHDTTVMFKESSGTLLEKYYKLLDIGGFGFVFIGESVDQEGESRKVAVKMFLRGMQDCSRGRDLDELLRISKKPEHLIYAYQEIRKEVHILSKLESPFVTELLGVKTSPYTCILLELAPKRSLTSILKEYAGHGCVLQPITLKCLAYQVAAGLAHLHSHEIVHMDMKSSNILVWYFPSASESYSTRVVHAGDVWIKITDYGISQVCTELTLKVGNCSAGGTPGYIAPEALEIGSIKEISADKVDVFAYGMTLYETLSFHAPFYGEMCVPKRNDHVCNKKRPELCDKGKRSPVLYQDLITLCWSHEPRQRPVMSKIETLAKKVEFELLRAASNLGNITKPKSYISCACVSRTCSSMLHGIADRKISETSDRKPLQYEQFEPNTSVIKEKAGTCDSSASNKEEIVHFSSNESLNEPSIQIWIFEHVNTEHKPETKAFIYTYQDGCTGSYRRSASFKEEITTVCPVHNMIWMGTESGTIIVVDATKQTKICSGKLNEPQSSTVKAEQPIIGIEHLDSKSEECVIIVMNKNGIIWSLYEGISDDGFILHCQLWLPEQSICSCCHITKVSTKTDSEVWGTMMGNRVFVLEKEISIERVQQRMIKDEINCCTYKWKNSELLVNPSRDHMTNPSHIVHTNFIGRSGSEENHVWISYDTQSTLVSFDAETRKQRCMIDLCDFDHDPNQRIFSTEKPEVTAMTTAGKKIIIGAAGGEVVILNSEGKSLLAFYSWHKGEVKELLTIPEEIKPCICAEIPFEQPDDVHDAQRSKGTENIHAVPNPEPNATMIASIGKGRMTLDSSQNSESDTYFLIWKSQ